MIVDDGPEGIALVLSRGHGVLDPLEASVDEVGAGEIVALNPGGLTTGPPLPEPLGAGPEGIDPKTVIV